MMTRAPSSPAVNVPNATDRPPPMRVGDHLALDFANTIAAPKGSEIEWIGSGKDLLDWLTGSGAISPAEAQWIAGKWSPDDLNKVAQEAIELREWFRTILFRAKAAGTTALALADLNRLNAILERDATFRRIEPADANGQLRVTAERAWRDPGQLLVPIASAMAELLCECQIDLVRKCENPPCSLWFYDRTKGHRRRWCSQAMCGNRAKVAAFRVRKRLEC